MRSCPEPARALPIVPSPLPTWSEIPLRQRQRLVAVVCQMVLADLLRQSAAREASDEHDAH
jgi:hypothetical protein